MKKRYIPLVRKTTIIFTISVLVYFIWFAKSIIDHKSIKTLDALCNIHYNWTIKGINGLLRLILKLEEATLTDRSYIDFNNISESDIVNIENHKC